MAVIRPIPNRREQRAFNLLELMVLMALGMIVVAFFLSQTTFRHRRRGHGPDCVNNLKQIALAFRIWAGDNNDQYPTQAVTNETGGQKFANANDMFRYLQMMSNELSNPRLLVCPEDPKRLYATNFGPGFTNNNISYFIGLNATEDVPEMLLAGDSQLTNTAPRKNGVQLFSTNQAAWWTTARHKGTGNIAITDGSVARLSTNSLPVAFGNRTNYLLFP